MSNKAPQVYLDNVFNCRYELLHVVRTHLGACTASYDCVYQREDTTGQVSLYQQSAI